MLRSCLREKRENPDKMDRQEKIQLIKNVLEFGRDHLTLNSKTDFSDVNDNRDMQYWLYLSKNNKIKLPLLFEKTGMNFFYFNTKKNLALKTKEFFDFFNYHTLAYGSPGSSEKLSSGIFNYENEIIPRITLHEMTHEHLKNKKWKGKINYSYEESLCDLMGLKGAVEYSKQDKRLNTNVAKKIDEDYDKIVDFLNLRKEEIDNNNPGKDFYKKEQEKFSKIKNNLSAYEKQRFDYDFNNAFFLRYSSYCEKYPFWREKFKEKDNLEDFCMGLDNVLGNIIGEH